MEAIKGDVTPPMWSRKMTSVPSDWWKFLADQRGGDSSLVRGQLVKVQQIQASTSAFAALRADGVIIAWGAPDCGGHFRNAGPSDTFVSDFSRV
ncbi:unnamed protein product [Cladocopium goreaui]|uniref:Ubiquitin-like domain-containing protein n=1 Tax=Cladocopium goreaui TaxID=2562237 RepID=A0A9P1CQ33_9DINO|nr:unnamed protein product [Cladocopium goreaui]